MEVKKNKKWRNVLLWLLLIVIFLCTALFGIVFQNFRNIIYEQMDLSLRAYAEAADRNLESIFDRCTSELNFIFSRNRFHEAENDWLQNGNAETFMENLWDNSLAASGFISEIIATKDGVPLLASSGETAEEHIFPNGVNPERPTLCLDPDGSFYLAFTSEEDSAGICFSALMDLERLYGNIVGDADTEALWVLLYDAENDVLLRTDFGTMHADQVDLASGATWRKGGIEILMEYEEKQLAGTETYHFTNAENQIHFDDRMVIIPSCETDNGIFAVGIASDCSQLFTKLRSNVLNLLLYTAIILAGVGVLGITLMRYKRASRISEENMRQLSEQNRSMQELIDKMQEFSHHQRLEIIGTMTAGIAHEFNNLLTPIMGYSLLTLEDIPEDQTETYDNLLEIYNASLRAKELVSRLSALSKKTSSAQQSYLSPDELVNKVLAISEPGIPHKVNISHKLACPEKCIKGNETQLIQLMLNLIINAYQAIGDAAGEVTLSTEHDAKEGKIKFRIRDSGHGISEADMPHIFEPFFSTKGPSKGTGLGLAICQQIAETHGGQITAESKPGQGSCFTLELPEAVEPIDGNK